MNYPAAAAVILGLLAAPAMAQPADVPSPEEICSQEAADAGITEASEVSSYIVECAEQIRMDEQLDVPMEAMDPAPNQAE